MNRVPRLPFAGIATRIGATRGNHDALLRASLTPELLGREGTASHLFLVPPSFLV